MITRNPHCDDAGYRVGYRTGPALPSGKRGWVTVYDAEEQGIPASDGGRWAIVCQEHSALLQIETLAQAKIVAQCGSDEFCDCCRGTCGEWAWAPCPTCGRQGQPT